MIKFFKSKNKKEDLIDTNEFPFKGYTNPYKPDESSRPTNPPKPLQLPKTCPCKFNLKNNE